MFHEIVKKQFNWKLPCYIWCQVCSRLSQKMFYFQWNIIKINFENFSNYDVSSLYPQIVCTLIIQGVSFTYQSYLKLHVQNLISSQ